MSVALKWKANSWDDAPILCRLFGHIWRSGWWGDRPYLTSFDNGEDGIGTKHLSLYCECDRCGNLTPVANMHGEKK